VIHGNTSGSGTPILLIHGFCETSDIWSDLQTQLSSSYQVISIDLPGFGKSSFNATIQSLDEIANEISNFLLTKNISQCFVIGHSLGGYVALSLARNNPDMLLGFGLFHSTTFSDDEEKKKIRDKTVEFVENHGIELWAKGFISNLFYSPNISHHQGSIKGLIKMVSQTKLEVFSAYSVFMKNRIDSTEFLKNYQKPIFLIAGEQDTLVSMSQSRYIRDHITIGDSLILPETGHMGFIERTGKCISFIKTFLKNNNF
jgi:pimeloyl-ACP methyl ester carboxylesterase